MIPANPVNNKFKTSLCRHYDTVKGCQVGEKCQFAHGTYELRSPDDPMPPMAQTHNFLQQVLKNPSLISYKTMKCYFYERDNFCKFGSACHFAHSDSDLKSANDITSLNTIATAINFELNQQYFCEMMQAKNQQQYQNQSGYVDNQNDLYGNQMYKSYSYGQSNQNPNYLYQTNLLGQDDYTPDTNFGEAINNKSNEYISNYPQYSQTDYAAAYNTNYEQNNDSNANYADYNYSYEAANPQQMVYDRNLYGDPNAAVDYQVQNYIGGEYSNQIGNYAFDGTDQQPSYNYQTNANYADTNANSAYAGYVYNNDKNTGFKNPGEVYKENPIRSEIYKDENTEAGELIKSKGEKESMDEVGLDKNKKIENSEKGQQIKNSKEKNEKIIFHFNTGEGTENKDEEDAIDNPENYESKDFQEVKLSKNSEKEDEKTENYSNINEINSEGSKDGLFKNDYLCEAIKLQNIQIKQQKDITKTNKFRIRFNQNVKNKNASKTPAKNNIIKRRKIISNANAESKLGSKRKNKRRILKINKAKDKIDINKI